MFSFNLKAILDARGIDKPIQWMVKNGLSHHSATRFIYTNVRVISLDHLEFFCKHLVCDPRDLLLWRHAEGDKVPDDHPLRKHNRELKTIDWQKSLAHMPLEQLQELKEALIEKGKQIP